MMDRTDRHYRYFMRRSPPHPALHRDDHHWRHYPWRRQLLGFDPSEHPIALQVGGDTPAAL